jgi:hypothetical protein
VIVKIALYYGQLVKMGTVVRNMKSVG